MTKTLLLLLMLFVEIYRSPFSKWKTICIDYKNYLAQGKQCDGKAEGVIIRNPGSFDKARINGLPTGEDFVNMYRLIDGYDIQPFNQFSKRSFRNFLEGFVNPNTAEYGEFFNFDVLISESGV